MEYFEKEVLFPVLNASPENFPDEHEKLASAQLGVIEMLHTMYYPCKTADAMRQSILISLITPQLRPLWSDLQSLGFLTMLDESVLLS